MQKMVILASVLRMFHSCSKSHKAPSLDGSLSVTSPMRDHRIHVEGWDSKEKDAPLWRPRQAPQRHKAAKRVTRQEKLASA
jgi:hypothetical protein